jgi:hypothetical protein
MEFMGRQTEVSFTFADKVNAEPDKDKTHN